MRRGPLSEPYPLHLICQVWLAADLAGTKTQSMRACDDGPSAALAEESKTEEIRVNVTKCTYP